MKIMKTTTDDSPTAITTQPLSRSGHIVRTLERSDVLLMLAIQKAGSLSKAAAQLGISAPVATKRLATLEAGLGMKLFFRTTRSNALTTEGELLCQHARRIAREFEAAEESLRDQLLEPTGNIRLAATFGFGRQWLGPALAAFTEQYQQVKIDVQLTEKLPDLGAAGFDAAVWLWSPSETRNAQWSARMLARNERVLVAAPAYVSARGAPQSLDELAQHQCLVVRESELPGHVWSLSRAGGRKMQSVQVQGALSSNSGELVRDWCVQGRGIMLRSLWDVAPLLASGALVQVLPQWAMRNADIQWLAPFRVQPPQRVRLLSDFLAARFKSAPWGV